MEQQGSKVNTPLSSTPRASRTPLSPQYAFGFRSDIKDNVHNLSDATRNVCILINVLLLFLNKYYYIYSLYYVYFYYYYITHI